MKTRKEKLTTCKSSGAGRPELIKGSKKRKRKTIPMSIDKRSIVEIRQGKKNVELCIPKLALARLSNFV